MHAGLQGISSNSITSEFRHNRVKRLTFQGIPNEYMLDLRRCQRCWWVLSRWGISGVFQQIQSVIWYISKNASTTITERTICEPTV